MNYKLTKILVMSIEFNHFRFD